MSFWDALFDAFFSSLIRFAGGSLVIGGVAVVMMWANNTGEGRFKFGEGWSRLSDKQAGYIAGAWGALFVLTWVGSAIALVVSYLVLPLYRWRTGNPITPEFLSAASDWVTGITLVLAGLIWVLTVLQQSEKRLRPASHEGKLSWRMTGAERARLVKESERPAQLRDYR